VSCIRAPGRCRLTLRDPGPPSVRTWHEAGAAVLLVEPAGTLTVPEHVDVTIGHAI